MESTGICIGGDTGVAIDAKYGSVININLNNRIDDQGKPSSAHEEKTRSIRRLLRLCEIYAIRPRIEHIALTLYGSKYFKSLTVKQLDKLQTIAIEIGELLYNKPMTCRGDLGLTRGGPCIGEKQRNIGGVPTV